jgi:hypothetical protein
MTSKGEQTLEMMREFGIMGWSDKVQDTPLTGLVAAVGVMAVIYILCRTYQVKGGGYTGKRVEVLDFGGRVREVRDNGFTQFKDVRLKLDPRGIMRSPDGLPYRVREDHGTPIMDYDLMDAEIKAGAKCTYVRRPKGFSLRARGNASSRVAGQGKLGG